MTAAQAYQILNVSPGASQREIERAYMDVLRVLQLQLVPGQPVAARQKAQDQIAELKSAFEFLKNMAGSGGQPTWGGGYAAPQTPPAAIPQVPPMTMPPIPPAAVPYMQPLTGLPVQPVAGFAAQPPGMAPNPFHQGPVASAYSWIVPAGFILAAAVMVLVIVICVGSTASLESRRTAKLRVLSVPWSYVQVDGESLGPSGQVDAFALKPGEHEVVLRQGDRVLSQTVHLLENSETVIKAQLEKGQIDVAHKQI
jgi:hypothetical protein